LVFARVHDRGPNSTVLGMAHPLALDGDTAEDDVTGM
jgi:hypothetical protein